MEEERTEGIVLRSFDYKDRQKILTLFSPKEGLISLIVHGLSSRKSHLLALTSPFCHAEFIYRKTRSDLSRFIDGTVLDEHLNFRTQYSFLQTAGTLAQAILRSQMPGKATPVLYFLFRSYFKQITTFENPAPLIASFHLKLLKHEGLLALEASCTHCQGLPAQHLDQGQSVCSLHRAPGSLSFTPTEWDTLLQLENATHFHALRQLPLSPQLSSRIAIHFHERLRQD
jgi:DNA repair protein RecO (recombination protein O)